MAPTIDSPRPESLGRAMPASRAGERGFSLIELIVVLLIIAVLMAIIAPQFRGARVGTQTAVVKSTAQTYAEAVDAFALDHAGRVPVLGSADWPAAAITAGPRKPSPDAVTSSTTYIGRGIPEAVQGTSVALTNAVVRGGATPPANGTSGVVRYVVGPIVAPATVPTSYRIEVWATTANRKLPTTMTCYLGTAAAAGVKQCA